MVVFMNSLVRGFLREIINEHLDIPHVCDDYEIRLTEENKPFIKEMIELDDNEERKAEDLPKLEASKVGDRWFMYGFDRNRYVKQKIFG